MKIKKGFITMTTIAIVGALTFNTYAFREISNGVDISLYDVSNTFFSIRENMKVYSDEGVENLNRVFTITDAGRFENRADVVKISKLYWGEGIDLSEMYQNGYNTLVLEIQMEVNELDDGYQYIFIYDDLERDSWLAGGKFEHGSGYLKSEKTIYYFYIELNISDITNNDFVIRYDASGKNDDDWQCNNVFGQIGFSTETRSESSIWMTSKENAQLCKLEKKK